MASASDVPHKFDVVINSQGYVLADSEAQKAVLGYTPIFVPRTDTQGDYGDNKQDFWLTYSQRDWSLGEQQRYYRQNGDEAKRRYWQGSAVDIRIPGQVSMRAAASTFSAAAAVQAQTGAYIEPTDTAFALAYATTTNLYTIDSSLTVTDRGAHGLGGSPDRWGMIADPGVIYMSSTGTKVRKWLVAGFSDFSASGASSLAFLNNTLYGLRAANGDLVRWDTAGTLTSLYTWKRADGTALPNDSGSKIVAFGGKLAILRLPVPATVSVGGGGLPELYIYDGTAPALIHQFPAGFAAYDICVAAGMIFVSGTMPLASGSGSATCPVIFFYANGQVGMLWRSYTASTVAPAMTAWNNGLIFTDASRSALMAYDAEAGGVHTLSTAWSNSGSNSLTSTGTFLLGTNVTTTAYTFLDSGSAPSSATVTSSLSDYDSSLTKLFRGIKVEFDAGSDGNGGSVDIAYRVGDVDGSYTTLQTGATSGTEYLLTNITGRSISVKVTLNKGTSTNGPVLKRISVRAVPVQPGFKQRTYALSLYGRDGEQRGVDRQGQSMQRDALEMASDLQTAATSSTPFTIADALGSFTGIIESLELRAIRSQDYIAVVKVREV